jgi:hypothetical protein
MEAYSQMQYQNEQFMLYQTMQAQQQAYYYNSMMQTQPEVEQELKPAKQNGKRAYTQCDLWKRESLVEKVEKEGLTIKDAAKELAINYSTAKHIMKVFRQSGKVETKIMMKRKSKDTCDYFPESSTQSVSNVAMETYEQAQSCLYDMGITQCQLPIDMNMMNVNYQP